MQLKKNKWSELQMVYYEVSDSTQKVFSIEMSHGRHWCVDNVDVVRVVDDNYLIAWGTNTLGGKKEKCEIFMKLSF